MRLRGGRIEGRSGSSRLSRGGSEDLVGRSGRRRRAGLGLEVWRLSSRLGLLRRSKGGLVLLIGFAVAIVIVVLEIYSTWS